MIFNQKIALTEEMACLKKKEISHGYLLQRFLPLNENKAGCVVDLEREIGMRE